MSEFATYSADQVIVIFAGLNVRGYAKDTFVEVERDGAIYTKYAGALGDIARSRNLDKSGKVTLTLMAVSPTNDELYGLAFLDEADGTAYGSLQVKDLTGNMICSAEIAWVEKWPKVERGKESGTIQWVIDCAGLEIRPGGNSTIVEIPLIP